MHFWGRGIIFAVILSILMVPTQAFLIPQFEIVQNLGLMNTVWGIAAPGVFSAFGTFLMRQAFLGLPSEIEEAARLAGAAPWQMFWRVRLPLTKIGRASGREGGRGRGGGGATGTEGGG